MTFDTHKRRIATYLTVIAFAVFSVWSAQHTASKAQDAAHEAKAAAVKAKQNAADLEHGLVQSCRTNGNPLRIVVADLERVIRNQVQADVAQSERLQQSGAYETLFPGVPPKKLHVLLASHRREQLSEIRHLDNAVRDVKIHVNCARVFKTPG